VQANAEILRFPHGDGRCAQDDSVFATLG